MNLDPQKSTQALTAALQQFPQFAEFSPQLVWRELADDGALMVAFEQKPEQGTAGVWDFQNAVVREYKRLCGEQTGGGHCGG